jgi:hypothetical protein
MGTKYCFNHSIKALFAKTAILKSSVASDEKKEVGKNSVTILSFLKT